VRPEHRAQQLQQLAAGYSTGVVAAQKGYKRAMTITWNYARTGNGEGLTEAFEKAAARSSRT